MAELKNSQQTKYQSNSRTINSRQVANNRQAINNRQILNNRQTASTKQTASSRQMSNNRQTINNRQQAGSRQTPLNRQRETSILSGDNKKAKEERNNKQEINDKILQDKLKALQKDSSANTKEKKKKSNSFKKVGRKIKKIILIFIISFLSLILIAGVWFYSSYGKTILRLQSKAKSLAAMSTADTFRQSETSLVYAADGSLISKIKAEKDVYYLEFDAIPKTAVQAMLATEDRKFYEHGGVDLLANIRASILLIKNKGEIHQGGSTITQQLARGVFLTNEVTWERKITEIFLAEQLEKKYSKNQILEFYLNTIYFANGYYGIQAAANGYFSESAKDLSLSQIAFLCAIPNNPTKYNPVTNYKNTMERRDKVLMQMYEEGYITKDAYRSALREKIVLNMNTTELSNYVESYARYCAIRALMKEEGFVFRNEFIDEADRENYEDLYYDSYYRIQKTLFTGGYRIYTSIDMKMQEILQNTVNNTLSKFTETGEDGVYTLQGAAVCIDNDTGRVVAIVGGREQEGQEGYTLNRAYQSYRQPGSAIKPIVVYTPMFERGLKPNSIVVDEKFEGGPRNAENTYVGEMTVRRAVEVSKNTVAWKLFEELTPKVGLSYLYQMNFSKLSEQDYVPAASLGGLTYGTSPVEMASAYSTLANHGVYRNPTCIVKIMDAKGKLLVSDYISETPIYKESAVVMMTDVLKGVMTNGTGRRLALNGITSAGKTGTTADRKDGWFCGYTGYYSTAVWVGYDMPKKLSDLAGNSYPGYIWRDFMQEIHKGLSDIQFEPYIEEVKTEPEIIWDSNENEDNLEEEDSLGDENNLEDENSLENEDNLENENGLGDENNFADEDNLENEDNMKDEDNLQDENGFESEDNSENEDGMRGEDNLENENGLGDENNFADEDNPENEDDMGDEDNLENENGLGDENSFADEDNPENENGMGGEDNLKNENGLGDENNSADENKPKNEYGIGGEDNLEDENGLEDEDNLGDESGLEDEDNLGDESGLEDEDNLGDESGSEDENSLENGNGLEDEDNLLR